MTGSGARGEALINNCVAEIRERCEDRAIGLFDVPGGIQRLLEHGKMLSYKYCLFATASGLRTIPSQKEKLLKKIETGSTDKTVYDNCVWFFELLFLSWNVDLLGSFERASFMPDKDFVETIWRTVTSRKIQFRLHSEYRSVCTKLVASGIEPDSIPLPADLAQSDAPVD